MSLLPARSRGRGRRGPGTPQDQGAVLGDLRGLHRLRPRLRRNREGRPYRESSTPRTSAAHLPVEAEARPPAGAEHLDDLPPVPGKVGAEHERLFVPPLPPDDRSSLDRVPRRVVPPAEDPMSTPARPGVPASPPRPRRSRRTPSRASAVSPRQPFATLTRLFPTNRETRLMLCLGVVPVSIARPPKVRLLRRSGLP